LHLTRAKMPRHAPYNSSSVERVAAFQSEPQDQQSQGESGTEEQERHAHRKHYARLSRLELGDPRVVDHLPDVPVSADRQDGRDARHDQEEHDDGGHGRPLPSRERTDLIKLPLQCYHCLYRH
jgi:hypothetical protein